MATTSEREHTGDLIIDAANTVPDNSLLALYGTISITTILHHELGTTINEYETKFPVKIDSVKPAVKMCKENFERLLVMINEGTAKGISPGTP